MSRTEQIRRAIDAHDRSLLRDCRLADVLVDVLAPGESNPSLGDLMHEARPAAAALPDEDVLARWDRDNDGERWCGLS